MAARQIPVGVAPGPSQGLAPRLDAPPDPAASATTWRKAYGVGYFGERRAKPYANEEYALTTGPGSPAYPLGNP